LAAAFGISGQYIRSAAAAFAKFFELILTHDSAHENCYNSIKFKLNFCKINNSSEKLKKEKKLKNW